MGFFDNVKKGAKSYVDQYKKTSADNRAYRNEVNEAVKKAKRESFKKEAVKQAQLRAKIQAKQKFNPSPQASGIGGGMSAEARALIYGSGFGSPQVPKERVVQRIVQNRSPTKKKKKKGSKTRTIVKYVEKPRSSDPVSDILSRLPE